MPTCRYGWSLNTTRMSISAMFGREPTLRCPVWKPSIVSDAPRMQIVGEGRARVAGSDKVHDGVVRRANVELEFLAGRHLLEHFHSQLEVARLAPGSHRLIAPRPNCGASIGVSTRLLPSSTTVSAPSERISASGRSAPGATCTHRP